MPARVLFVVLLGCAPIGPKETPPSGPAQAEEPYVEQPPARAEDSGAPADSRASTCEPLPKEGDPCGPEDGYCVVDWGQPGGHSTALWCVDGIWEIELERNLPE